MAKATKDSHVKANIIKIIACIEQDGVRRDYRRENSAYIAAIEECRRRDCGLLYDEHSVYEKYEDYLYEYSQKDWGSYVKEDEWSGKARLYSFQKWYEIKLEIQYTIKGKDYKKVVDIEHDKRVLPHDFVYIWYCDNNPDIIQNISLEETDLSLLILCSICGVLIVFLVALLLGT